MTTIEHVRPSTHILIWSKAYNTKAREEDVPFPTPVPTPPPTHTALTVNENYQYEFCEAKPPVLGEYEVLLRTKALGLNPIDWKSVEYKFCMPSLPWINGRECSAVVEKVGLGVTSLAKGQRVWTSTYYKDRRAGCFQDLIVVPEHTVILVPDSVSFDKAACLGVGGLTAAMTIWKWFGLPMRRKRLTRSASAESRFILIWGGSTITGQFAIQIALEAGLRVIAVASQRTRQRVVDLGAHHVIVRDGKSLEAITTEIRGIGEDNVVFGMDLVSSQTAVHGIRCLSNSLPAKFAPLAGPTLLTQTPANMEILNVEMKQFVLDPTMRQYAVKLTELVAQGRVKLPEMVVSTGGLRDVEAGLCRLRSGNMGGKKLVVRMEN